MFASRKFFREVLQHGTSARRALWLALAATLAAGALPVTARAASNDNNVEWNGLFHDQGPVGLGWSRREFGCARTDFRRFGGPWWFHGLAKRRK